jgi:hypothetical protein
MLDYTNYNYKEKPFTRTNKFGIHPLSHTGQHEYVCKDSQVHWFMHMVPPRLLAELYGSKEAIQEEDETPYPRGVESNTMPQEFDSENLPGEAQKNETDPYDYTRTWGVPEGNNSHKYYTNKPQTTAGTFRRTNFSKPKQNARDSRFYNDYMGEVECLRTQRGFNATSTGFRTKKYDGFTYYDVPRTEPSYKEEFRKSKIVSNKIYNSIYNPTCITVDINEQNERLRSIFNTQTNKSFLKSNKLPHIEVIVNQPKTLLKKTNTSTTKMMGGKYNPFNYHGTNKNWTKRNYLGALYQH